VQIVVKRLEIRGTLAKLRQKHGFTRFYTFLLVFTRFCTFLQVFARFYPFLHVFTRFYTFSVLDAILRFQVPFSVFRPFRCPYLAFHNIKKFQNKLAPTNCSAHTGVLEFFVRETSSNSGLGVVSEGWALDNGSERTGDWSWGDSCGFGGSRGSSGDLFGWLVKPGLGEFGPCLSLSEMRVWEDSVKMNGHFLNFCKFDLRL